MSDVFDRARSVEPRQAAAMLGLELSSSGQSPCPFCGGTDRFYLHKSGRFGCRGCGFRGDAVDLATKMRGSTPLDAAAFLSGGSIRGGIGRPVRRETGLSVAHRGKQVQAPTPEWAENALSEVERAERAFPGSPAEVYMAERGFGPEVCREYRIGYDPRAFDPAGKTFRPAVVVPWLDREGRPVAVKYRYLDDLGRTDKGRRFSARKGSTPSLFGLHALRGLGRLAVVEGEMNALAVRTACPDADAVSVGSQGGAERALAELRDLAARYREVVVWADEPEAAKRWAAAVGRAELRRSPYGKDANDVLREYGAAGVRKVLGFASEAVEDARAGWAEATGGSVVENCGALGLCMTDFDGFDPWAADDSAERSAERLLDRLRSHGIAPALDDAGRVRIPGCPEYLREDAKRVLERLAVLLAKDSN